MKSFIVAFALLAGITGVRAFAAEDEEIRGSYPENLRLVRIDRQMESLTESIRCATFIFPIAVIGVKTTSFPAKTLKVDEAQRTFTATFSAEREERLRNSFCRYRGAGYRAVFENQDGDEIKRSLTFQNGQWITE